MTSPRLYEFSDASSGLDAVIVVDDLRLGPAAGGIRTRRYATRDEAIEDCRRLARAMTIKCALAELEAGGGKGVVILHDGMNRSAAFEILGQRVEELGGIFRTAGDYGTTRADLLAMAKHTRYVHTELPSLSVSVGRGVAMCIAAALKVRNPNGTVAGLKVLVQGAGAMGSAVARQLKVDGAELWVSDLDAARASALSDELGAKAVPAADALLAEVDVIAPCAVGGVIDAPSAERMQCEVVCGAANNILASEDAGRILKQRNILFVPDQISSAGAVVDGIGQSVMGLKDRSPLIERLGETAFEVLTGSLSSQKTPTELAFDKAQARLDAARC